MGPKKMDRERIMTGIKPSGRIHFGNIIGAIMPSLQAVKDRKAVLLLCLADYHALTEEQLESSKLSEYTYEICKIVLNLAEIMKLSKERIVLYRQSKTSTTFALFWKLLCLIKQGQMERLHSIKQYKEKDQDKLNMGIYTYPVLMAADMISIAPNLVIVASDQKQHIEYGKLLLRRYCQKYKIGGNYKLNAIVNESKVFGNDGRKMSKSYGNAIDPFMSYETLSTYIMKTPTDSTPIGEPIEIEDFALVELIRSHCSEEVFLAKKEAMHSGDIGWREIKEYTLELLDNSRGNYTKERDDIEKRIEIGEALISSAMRDNPLLEQFG
jgi:tryptophanyl-tRNA synthetase